MANSISHAALPYPIKNARFTVLVPYLDADGDPTDPTTPDTEFSGDAGAYADTAEEVTTITGSNGTGYITVTGAETNYSAVALAFKVASGPKATLLLLSPRDLPIIEAGTAQAGAAGSLTLAAGAPAYDITGCLLRTTGGTGGGGTGGANNQARLIVAYNTSTKVATVRPNWETTPDGTTTYDLLLPDGMALGALKALAPTTLGRALDVSAGGEAGVDWANVGSPTTSVTLSGTTVNDVTTKTGYGIGVGGIAATAFAAGAIDAAAIAANAIGASEIADGAIDAATFAAGAIDAAAIAAGAIGVSEAPNLDAAISTRATPAQVNTEVLDVLNTDTFAEPGQQAPPATTTIVTKLGYLYKFLRNRVTQTDTTLSVYGDNATTVDHKATVSDDATTYDRGEIGSGP